MRTQQKRKSFAGQLAMAAVALMAAAVPARASVALLMEEPFGGFGKYNPTGHAAVYLNHLCAESPTQLRPCHAGEYGVVISRYHKVDGKDWLAVPLVSYLYAVDDFKDIPQTATEQTEIALRAKAWRAHLQFLAPGKDGEPPKGEWIQLVGASYDRTIHGFQIETTEEQDARFMAIFNDRRNVGHFNLFFHNCADFSRVVLDTYFPHALHRNFIGDLGMTTPRQDARSLVAYGRKHPELKMTTFIIPQVPGTVPRSIPIDGVSGAVVKDKKYIIPLAILTPEFAGAMVVDYLAEGREKLPKTAPMFEVGDEENGVKTPIVLPGEAPAAKPAEEKKTSTS